MAKQFLIKRDPTRPCSEENWLLMNFLEFRQWRESEEGKSRKLFMGEIFKADMHDDIIYIECSEKEKKKCKQKLNEIEYRRRTQREVGYQLVSYEAVEACGDSMGGEESLPDLETNVEDTVIRGLEVEGLREVIKHLSDEERDLLFWLFLCDAPMTMRKYAKQIGVSLGALSHRKEALFDKIRGLLGEN